MKRINAAELNWLHEYLNYHLKKYTGSGYTGCHAFI